MSKKVVPIICEGQSDALALEDYFSDIFKEKNIEFIVCGGDFLGDIDQYDKDLEELVYDSIFNSEKPVDFCIGDILMIAHIVDTDGVFIDDSNLYLDTTLPGTTYLDDKIFVCKNVAASIDARQKRRERINDSIYKEKINLKGNIIPYQLFYMSCNLEHVTQDERNVYSEDEKVTLAEEFSGRYTVKEFINFLVDMNASNTVDYFSSWNYIKMNSLQKATNLIILINILFAV